MLADTEMDEIKEAVIWLLEMHFPDYGSPKNLEVIDRRGSDDSILVFGYPEKVKMDKRGRELLDKLKHDIAGEVL